MKKTKLSQVRECAAKGDWQGAIRIAAKFPDLGEEKAAITRAHGCYTNPRFFQQVGVDCESAIAEGRAALSRRFGF